MSNVAKYVEVAFQPALAAGLFNMQQLLTVVQESPSEALRAMAAGETATYEEAGLVQSVTERLSRTVTLAGELGYRTELPVLQPEAFFAWAEALGAGIKGKLDPEDWIEGPCLVAYSVGHLFGDTLTDVNLMSYVVRFLLKDPIPALVDQWAALERDLDEKARLLAEATSAKTVPEQFRAVCEVYEQAIANVRSYPLRTDFPPYLQLLGNHLQDVAYELLAGTESVLKAQERNPRR